METDGSAYCQLCPRLLLLVDEFGGPSSGPGPILFIFSSHKVTEVKQDKFSFFSRWKPVATKISTGYIHISVFSFFFSWVHMVTGIQSKSLLYPFLWLNISICISFTRPLYRRLWWMEFYSSSGLIHIIVLVITIVLLFLFFSLSLLLLACCWLGQRIQFWIDWRDNFAVTFCTLIKIFNAIQFNYHNNRSHWEWNSSYLSPLNRICIDFGRCCRWPNSHNNSNTRPSAATATTTTTATTDQVTFLATL